MCSLRGQRSPIGESETWTTAGRFLKWAGPGGGEERVGGQGIDAKANRSDEETVSHVGKPGKRPGRDNERIPLG